MDKFVVIDLETTGNSPADDDKIIDVGIVVIQNDVIVDQYSTLIHPGRNIPPFITNLTGITNDDVRNAPSFHKKAADIANYFTNSYLVAHNVPFDVGFLNAELIQANMTPLQNPMIDTVELSRILYPKSPGYKLSQLADHLNLTHDAPHRALSDAVVTAHLFLHIKQKLKTLPYETINHLLSLEKHLHSDLYHILFDCKQRLASLNNPPNIVSFGGIAFQKFAKQTSTNDETYNESFGHYLDDIYGVGGTMQQHIIGYEKRTGQREMSEYVYDAFQAKDHALIEAGTGTGKSIAYLIPALYEAVTSGERIVISTHTTQLQTQLLEEEIPLVKNLVPFNFTTVLLKGKSHYISLERFQRALMSKQKNNYDIALTKAIILVWLTETCTGDIDEIQLPSSGYAFFRSISAESEESIDPKSPWFQWSYYQRVKKRAQQADLIITNHALLCTDIYYEYQFIPSYRKVIIDEAHHLKDNASRQYGRHIDYLSMNYILTRMKATNDRKWLNNLMSKYPNIDHMFSLPKWNHLVEKALYDVDEFFRTIFQYVLRQEKKHRSFSDIGRIQYRFLNHKEEETYWQLLTDMAERITFTLNDMIKQLTHIVKVDALDKYDEDDLKNYIKTLQQFIDTMNCLFLNENAQQMIKWIEIDAYGAKNAVYVYSEPKDVSTHLMKDFFHQKESVILTSATLTIRRSFAFMQKQLGLSSDEVKTHMIDSPFPYDRQVQLLIPNDFPSIKTSEIDDYVYSTCEAILSLAQITKGRMLVLFTSYDMLNKAYHLLKDTLDLNEYMLIAQGISSGSRSRLKKNFQTFEKSILLGTSSFWEGIDIPGESLSCIVIARLPFQPPHHPVYEAKSEHFKKLGKNAFFELSLPHAVIRFKQGFGRLIRSTKDRGIVFVCDSRLMTARYGKFFLESIPKVPTTYDSTHQLMKKVEEWL